MDTDDADGFEMMDIIVGIRFSHGSNRPSFLPRCCCPRAHCLKHLFRSKVSSTRQFLGRIFFWKRNTSAVIRYGLSTLNVVLAAASPVLTAL